MRMRRVTWPGGMGLRLRLRRVYLDLEHRSPLYSSLRPKIVPTKGGPKLRFFVNYGIQMLFLCTITPKRHILTRNHVVWRILRENRFRGLGCGPLEGRGKRSRVNNFDAQFPAYGETKHLQGSWVNFACGWDVVTYATFDDDRLSGLGAAMGRIPHFPMDFTDSYKHFPNPLQTTSILCNFSNKYTIYTIN